MRELNEYKAEIFRRSKKRINKRVRIKKCVITTAATLCLFFFVCIPCVMLIERTPSDSAPQTTKAPTIDGLPESITDGITEMEVKMGKLEDFSFTITYMLGETLFYDSESGTLIKTLEDATQTKTLYTLDEQEKATMFRLIGSLDVRSYPSVYEIPDGKTAHGTGISIELSVKTSLFQKTVTISDISPKYEPKDKAQKDFFRVCNQIKRQLENNAL